MYKTNYLRKQIRTPPQSCLHCLGKYGKYKEKHGNCNVPFRYEEDNFRLGAWLSCQRIAKKNEKLSEEYQRQLEKVGVVWEVNKSWKVMFELLAKYKQKNGHCSVPRRYLEDGVALGNWLHAQKQAKKDGKLTEEYYCQLEYLGVKWIVKHDL